MREYEISFNKWRGGENSSIALPTNEVYIIISFEEVTLMRAAAIVFHVTRFAKWNTR